MKLSIAISPCPNDTFIYGAIANHKIDLPYDFEFSYHDIETLNKLAQSGSTDLIKMSFFNYFKVSEKYRLLPCGGALGRGVGPLLIANDAEILSKKENLRIAIPGRNTTAFFLLNYFNPGLNNVVEMPFDMIEQAILKNEVDAGVIIHENRFTYRSHGLHLITDLGTYWEEQTSSPIPLGCLAIRKDLDDEIGDNITKLIQQSILFANNNYKAIQGYVEQHAQEMDPEVIRAHIDLYVNDFSYDMGPEGWKAVDQMGMQLAMINE